MTKQQWYKELIIFTMFEDIVKIAVRYYSQSGRTEKIANAIAKATGTEAISVTDEAVLNDKYDVLFLGGAPYANIMAPELKKYADTLSSENVNTAALFTTAGWSRRTIRALRNILTKKGINVLQEAFFVQASQVDSKIPEAEKFAKNILTEIK